MDCYVDSSDRDYHTYGGQPTTDEMCFVFIVYYPAVEVTAVQSGKTPTALYNWMVDAQNNGYLSGDAQDILGVLYGSWPYNFDDFTYDSSKEGALEFYNRLWDPDYPEYDEHYYYCFNAEFDDINDETYAIPQPNNFTVYEPDIFECNDENDANNAVCTPTPEDLLNGPMSGATNLYQFISTVIVAILICIFV